MTVTLEIDRSVVQQLGEEAARRGVTVSALVEAELRRVLVARLPVAVEHSEETPNLPTWDSGGFRVDVADRDALYQLMDEE